MIPTQFLAPFIILLSFLISGCSSLSETSYSNTPAGVTQSMFDAIAENDVDKYLDSIIPEDRSQPGFFYYRNLVQGIFGIIGLSNMDASSPSISFRELEFLEYSREDNTALLIVSGAVRDLNLAMEDNFTAFIRVVNRDGAWLVNATANLPRIESYNITDMETSEFRYVVADSVYKFDIPIDEWEENSNFRTTPYETAFRRQDDDGTLSVMLRTESGWGNAQNITNALSAIQVLYEGRDSSYFSDGIVTYIVDDHMFHAFHEDRPGNHFFYLTTDVVIPDSANILEIVFYVNKPADIDTILNQMILVALSLETQDVTTEELDAIKLLVPEVRPLNYIGEAVPVDARED